MSKALFIALLLAQVTCCDAKKASEDYVHVFQTLSKSVDEIAIGDLIARNRDAAQAIDELSSLLLQRLRTASGKRKVERLRLWMGLIQDFVEDSEQLTPYAAVARLDILDFIERRHAAQYKLLSNERLKTPEGEARREALLALNELVGRLLRHALDVLDTNLG